MEPLTGPLPSIGWRWDPETDILSGSFKGNRKSGGLTGTVELTDGRVVVPSRPSRPGVTSVEVDTTLSVQTNPAESIFHLRIGVRRQVEVVRVADNFHIEVDQNGGLAGFWMSNVPPFTAFEDEM